MPDSFFSGRNHYDQGVAALHDWQCMQLIEASSRRLITLEGYIGTSIRLQRLADVCAAAQVLPIEHWKALPEAAVEPEKPNRIITFLQSPIVWFWIGVIATKFSETWGAS